MPESFQPRRRGNRPIFNITPMLEALEQEENKDRWLAFSMTAAQARSAKRQLEKRGKVDISVEVEGDNAVVYARRMK